MYEQNSNCSAVIKVLGVGGGGCNAINSMVDNNITSAEFIAVNTDNQALLLSKADIRLQIGTKLTKGLGAGSNPNVGEAAAEESKEEIIEVLKGTDLLFIAAGMGGGTGTGAASVIARIARELGILTIAFVTRPFSFEGKVRNANALKGLNNLKKYVDTLVVIPNDRLLQFLPPQTGVLDAFKVADDMLKQGIIGIVDLIATPSLINLDFADVDTIMRNQGLAHMGIGSAKGENRVIEAVRQAVSSPLLETTIEGAKSVILNVTGGRDFLLTEVNEAAELVQGIIDPQANIIFGANVDLSISDEIKITIIATGFASNEDEEKEDTISIKPILTFAKEEKKESVSPILQKIEKEESKEEVIIITKKEESESPVVQQKMEFETIVEQPKEEQAPKYEDDELKEKSKELPAFMRKLFGKK